MRSSQTEIARIEFTWSLVFKKSIALFLVMLKSLSDMGKLTGPHLKRKRIFRERAVWAAEQLPNFIFGCFLFNNTFILWNTTCTLTRTSWESTSAGYSCVSNKICVLGISIFHINFMRCLDAELSPPKNNKKLPWSYVSCTKDGLKKMSNVKKNNQELERRNTSFLKLKQLTVEVNSAS